MSYSTEETYSTKEQSYSSHFRMPSYQKFIRGLLKIKMTELGLNTAFANEARKTLNLRGAEGAMECSTMVKIANRRLKEKRSRTSHSTESRNYNTGTRRTPRRAPTRSLPKWCHARANQNGIRNKLRRLRTELRNANLSSRYAKFSDELRKKILGNIEKTLSMPAYRMAYLGDQVLRSVETV